ncbi:MAG: class I SAM-dependent methyltransferase [Anaerolineales bacterium]|nr:class I SAM-dependent methyltransferase [Anaerolineales bacterium]
MEEIVQLTCKPHGLPLNQKEDALVCAQGCMYELLNGIPRFVPTKNYTSSFGMQWNTFRSTQLDSFTRLTISRDRLTRIAGGSLDVFRDKRVLEAGCGAGRFTELMLEAGAHVLAVDLSNAVDANYENCAHYPHYFVCQADLMELPLPPEQFDIVFCIGVIQHTPSPEDTIKTLCSHVRPDGTLFIDHYSYEYPITPTRKWLRQWLLKQSAENAMRFVEWLVNLLWPLHKILYKYGDKKIVDALRSRFLYWSPVVDYYDAYPQLGEQLMYEWAMLDTHDILTDYYKHLRSLEEIESLLNSLGMADVVAKYGGNGVEASARKPVTV